MPNRKPSGSASAGRSSAKATPTRRGAGRPPKIIVNDITRGQIETMSALGLTQEQICLIIGISQDTLTRRFPDSLKLGRARAIVQVAQSLYKRAVAGDNVAALFYLRCQGGWVDKSGVQLSGPDGGAVKVEALRIELVDPPSRAKPS